MFWIITGISAVGASLFGLYEYDKRQVKPGDTVIVPIDKVSPEEVDGQGIANINALLAGAKAASAFIEVKQVNKSFKSGADQNQMRGLIGPGLPVVFNKLDVLSIIRNGKVIK